MLKVIVRNPEELARQRGTLAGLAAQLAPELVRQAVDAEIARQLRAQLREQGVDADVLVARNPRRVRTAAVLGWTVAAALAVALAVAAVLLF